MAMELATFLQQGSYAAEPVRRTISGLLSRGGSVGSITGGLVFPGDMQISAGGGMSVNVSTGECWIPGSNVSSQGGYYSRNAAAANLPIAASNPSNPRIDSVTATVTDAAYSGATNTCGLMVNTGTPTAGASLANLSGAPALPANSLLLGYVLVPAGASSVSGGNISNVAAPIILQGVSSPPPVDAFQAGVLYTKSITNGDGFVSATPPINSGTGVLTITPNGGWCYVGSPLIRASIPSSSQAVTPPSLPTASGYMAVAIDMVAPTTWGGQVSLVASSGAQQTSLALALANPPALVAGRVRLLDVVILNTAGVYSVAGYRDRRPWAVGAYETAIYTGADLTYSTNGFAVINTGLQARVECSGLPLRMTLRGSFNAGAGDAVQLEPFIDGANVGAANGGVRYQMQNVGSQGQPAGTYQWDILNVAAGSHLFAPAWSSPSSTTITLYATTLQGVTLSVEEITRPSVSNGTS